MGNFGHVFEQTFEACYRPYLETLAKFPELKTTAHFSGPLLEWIETNRADYLSQLKAMAQSGQLEMLSGGFYEPLLATIPEEDAIGQIRMMNDFLREKLGATPRGLWLAERIWSPTLPRVIARAGIEFTILDDTHFSYSGLADQDIHGYYITESQGYPLKLFPISKELRYSIPFDLPEVTLEKMRNAQEQRQCAGLTYADDGEKFGSWPDTWQWVYGDGYLEKWFQALQDNREWLEMSHFGDYLDHHSPTGRVYLPPASYEEMMEWALPVNTSRKLHDLKFQLDEKQIDGGLSRRFIRGGQWDNFLTKYPAANRMHKRMLLVSRTLDELPDSTPGKTEARRLLYRAQCNCSYWHGLFGGLYLNYLRHAVYENLIQAETLVRKASGQAGWETASLDYDLDGHDEIIARHPRLTAILAPARGGAVVELDFHPAAFNITNVLERQEETYHQAIRDHAHHEDAGDTQPQSIHDRVRFKQEGLESQLIYDRNERLSFQDYFVPKDITLDQVAAGTFDSSGNLAGQPFDVAHASTGSGEECRVELSRDLVLPGNGKSARLGKRLIFQTGGEGISAHYELTHTGSEAIHGLFAVEFNISLLAGDAPDRYYMDPAGEFSGRPLVTRGEVYERRRWAMRDEWSKVEISWTLDQPTRILFYPVETVSQSEDGFEKTYQGSCVWMLLEVDLQPGGKKEWEIIWHVKQFQEN